MSSPSSSTRSQQRQADNTRVTRHALRTANSIPSNCTTNTPGTPSKQLRVRALSIQSPKQLESPRSNPVRPKRKPSNDSDENSNACDETLNCENYESPAKKMRTVASDTVKRESSRSPTKQQQPALIELVEPVTSLEALANAKAAFKPGSVPGRLVGRDSERSTIIAFLTLHATYGNTKSGSLYVSGVPGTGKSAMIDEIIDDFIEAQKGEIRVRHMVGKINCMQFTDPQAIYKKIMSEFDIEEGAFDTNVKEPFRTLERAFGHMEGGDKVGAQTPSKKGRNAAATASVATSKKVMHLLVLDEIDQLATRDQSVLYRIFEWAALPGSTLVLIGIANALDLMQRYLPRLVGMTGGPKLLNFNPYGPPEISAIIKSRLLSLQDTTFKAIQKYNVSKSTSPSAKKQSKPLEPAPEQLVSFMQPSAVELCSRKASGTGDLRRALDLVRVSFENLEVETRRKLTKPSTTTDQENAPPLPSKAQTSLPCSDLDTPLTSLDGIPKVGVAHVLKAANSVSGPGPVQKVKVLATQQKAVLLVLMNVLGSAKGAFVKRTAGKELLLGDLHEAYVSVLKRKQVIKPVTKTEFGDIMGLFESVGLVSLGKAKEERLKKVQLECLPAQVEDGIRDDPVLWGMWKELVASASTLI
ncbi:AAA ATPase [Chytriomyces hyalinus]|nr:AAA ATPase [Chytriomyces hyalinus]